MEESFEQAKRTLEAILNREWALRGHAREAWIDELVKCTMGTSVNRFVDGAAAKPGFLMPLNLVDRIRGDVEERVRMEQDDNNITYIRKNGPEIIEEGSTQVLISLSSSYVAKVRPNGETSEHYVVKISDSLAYSPVISKTPEVLKELGFGVLDHSYFGMKKQGDDIRIGSGDALAICGDLRENGRFLVGEADDEVLGKLENGTELKQELEQGIGVLTDLHARKNSPYLVQIVGHNKESAYVAFRHMFLTQIDSTTNRGKLVMGDLDHVAVHRNDLYEDEPSNHNVESQSSSSKS